MKITDDVRKYVEERGYGDVDGETVLKARVLPVWAADAFCKVEGKGLRSVSVGFQGVRGGWLWKMSGLVF